MREQNDPRSPQRPRITLNRLVNDLRALGVEPGDALLVHASLRSIGRVEGGPATVVAALREAVGPTGNVVVPTSTEQNSMTSRRHLAHIAGLNAAQVPAYRQQMPAYDPAATPSTAGAVAEALRASRGAVRSGHPQSSFAAVGPAAQYLMAGHRLQSHLGEDSPLAKLYQRGARVLLIGTGYRACTALHLAEYRYTLAPPTRAYACVVAAGETRQWVSYTDVVLDDYEFPAIGAYLEERARPRTGRIGRAPCRLLPVTAAVDFAGTWMARSRRLAIRHWAVASKTGWSHL